MNTLFESASPSLIEQIFKIGSRKTFSESEIIFAEGEKAKFLPVIVSGGVKLVRYPELGKEFIIGFFAEGDTFAIPPALDGEAFPATAVAVSDSILLLVPREKFISLMENSTEFSGIVMNKMCGLLRQTAETINSLASSSPEHRVVNVLLRLVKDQPGKINLRRQDIADMAGLTTETTIRTIRKLAQRQFLEIVRGKIIVPDPSQLRALLA